MRAWQIEHHGGPEVLKLKQLEKKADPETVAVKVKAVGLNHLDLWVRNGVAGHKFPLPIIPGCDFSGELVGSGKRVLVSPILSCGKCAHCKANQEPLCAEFGLLGETTNGGLCETVHVRKRNLIALPSSISFEVAACLPIAYVTAWSMLFEKARLKKGERILIQAGGSGVSIAAIQLAKWAGAYVITTVGSKEKATRAKKIGADEVILYKETALKDALKEKVQVSLDHVGADTFLDSLKALSWGGRLVTCGATSGSEIKLDLKPIFFKNISILGTTMGSKKSLEKIVALVKAKKFTPVIDQVFEFKDAPQAYARLESREAFGKICIRSAT